MTFPILFEYQLDPATDMAAFPARERDEFMAHWTKIVADETVITIAVIVDGQVAGNVVSFDRLGEREVGYWIGRDHWGKGVATRALMTFLDHDRTRPLFARVATSNVASIRVLEKCGFTVADVDEDPRPARRRRRGNRPEARLRPRDPPRKLRAMTARLHGAIAASVTPMTDGGRSLDTDAIGGLTAFLAEGGVDGVLTCGTTGEGVLLSVDERRRVTEAFLGARPRRVPGGRARGRADHRGHRDPGRACARGGRRRRGRDRPSVLPAGRGGALPAPRERRERLRPRAVLPLRVHRAQRLRHPASTW